MGRGNRITGICGEEAAKKFLLKRGYKILEVNFRTPLGELDIIAKHRSITVFVEVKSRISSSLGPPVLNVTRKKIRHIVKNAQYYLKLKDLAHSMWRIDIVCVKLNYDCEVERVELIENAVEEGMF